MVKKSLLWKKTKKKWKKKEKNLGNITQDKGGRRKPETADFKKGAEDKTIREMKMKLKEAQKAVDNEKNTRDEKGKENEIELS